MYEMAEGGKSHGMASKRKNVSVELNIQWLVKNGRFITSSCHHSQLCSGFEDSTIIPSKQKNLLVVPFCLESLFYFTLPAVLLKGVRTVMVLSYESHMMQTIVIEK
jgi:hypothetical protein